MKRRRGAKKFRKEDNLLIRFFAKVGKYIPKISTFYFVNRAILLNHIKLWLWKFKNYNTITIHDISIIRLWIFIFLKLQNKPTLFQTVLIQFLVRIFVLVQGLLVKRLRWKLRYFCARISCAFIHILLICSRKRFQKNKLVMLVLKESIINPPFIMLQPSGHKTNRNWSDQLIIIQKTCSTWIINKFQTE